MSDEEKINLESKETLEDKKLNLRPRNLDKFIGQDNLKSNLKTYIESSKKRKNNLDHIILYGPPGLGKTTLSHIISYEKKNGKQWDRFILNSIMMILFIAKDFIRYVYPYSSL